LNEKRISLIISLFVVDGLLEIMNC